MDKSNPIIKFFTPQYNELTLFLISASFILIIFIDKQLPAQTMQLFYHYTYYFGWEYKTFTWFYILPISIGILLSFVHVVTKRKKTCVEKVFMLISASSINLLIAILSGLYILNNFAIGYMCAFPLINMLNSVLTFSSINQVNVDNMIIDDNTDLFQIIFGLVIITTVILVCNLMFNLYWAITFSICVTVATNIVTVTNKIFFSED